MKIFLYEEFKDNYIFISEGDTAEELQEPISKIIVEEGYANGYTRWMPYKDGILIDYGSYSKFIYIENAKIEDFLKVKI